mmetsp:Transcript_27353/g.48826  ORF Transcript_27353/g.48826 Transcript_27353/m.48826 type:complete len:309 (-) Transcript_27353:761-1687(-)
MRKTMTARSRPAEARSSGALLQERQGLKLRERTSELCFAGIGSKGSRVECARSWTSPFEYPQATIQDEHASTVISRERVPKGLVLKLPVFGSDCASKRIPSEVTVHSCSLEVELVKTRDMVLPGTGCACRRPVIGAGMDQSGLASSLSAQRAKERSAKSAQRTPSRPKDTPMASQEPRATTRSIARSDASSTSTTPPASAQASCPREVPRPVDQLRANAFRPSSRLQTWLCVLHSTLHAQIEPCLVARNTSHASPQVAAVAPSSAERRRPDGVAPTGSGLGNSRRGSELPPLPVLPRLLPGLLALVPE